MLHVNTYSTTKSHALVIGGSIAGMLAAQVLSKHFEQVTIVERDNLPEQPGQRPGVPQAQHGHILLQRGQQILEQLFPGLKTELIAAGAYSVNITADLLWYLNAWTPRFPSDITTINCSRNLLEWAIRRRVANNNRVAFLQGTQVIGLLSNSNHSRVTGVRVYLRNQGKTDFTADLVVDASGRNSHSTQWLEALGYATPQKTTINSFLGYASRWYQIPENFPDDWQVAGVWGKPPNMSRGGWLFKIEKNNWLVTLFSVNRDYPPTDEAGFLEFARSLRAPIIYEAIKNAQPISPVYSYRRTENCWHHYEKLSRFPEGLIVLGDAVCALNPVSGQGMSVSALSVLILDDCLVKQFSCHPHRNLIGLSKRFQRRLSQAIALPWAIATGEDLRWSTTEGGRPNFITRLFQQYVDQVLLHGIESPHVYKVFLEVMHLLKPPSTLLHPSIGIPVLLQFIKRFTHRSDWQVARLVAILETKRT
jgi:2-polyprenyl-6-methoxyphenol hydroxylase-like FAD-dependent oxidoreductase